jgi:transposase InsO family protein
LAAVKDLYTKQVVGYSLNERMTAKLVCDALNMAIRNQKPAKDLIVHSDRGSNIAVMNIETYLRNLIFRVQ